MGALQGRVVLAFSAIACLGFAGCGGGGEENLPVFPVSGKIDFQGRPTPGAIVVLHPFEGPPEARRPSAVVKEDGSFQVGMYATDDGAPAGKYRVTVVWNVPMSGRPAAEPSTDPDEMSDDDETDEVINQLPERYADPHLSGLTIEVKSEPLSLEPFHLTR
jgi:hypothetical protein